MNTPTTSPITDLFPHHDLDVVAKHERIPEELETAMAKALLQARLRVDAAAFLRAHRAALQTFRRLVNESIAQSLRDITDMEAWVNGGELPEQAKACARHYECKCDATIGDPQCDRCSDYAVAYGETLTFVSTPIRSLMLAATGTLTWNGAEAETRRMLGLIVDAVDDHDAQGLITGAAIEAIQGIEDRDPPTPAPTHAPKADDSSGGAALPPSSGHNAKPRALCMNVDAWARGAGVEVMHHA